MARLDDDSYDHIPAAVVEETPAPATAIYWPLLAGADPDIANPGLSLGRVRKLPPQVVKDDGRAILRETVVIGERGTFSLLTVEKLPHPVLTLIVSIWQLLTRRY